jgi:hypothetical protein
MTKRLQNGFKPFPASFLAPCYFATCYCLLPCPLATLRYFSLASLLSLANKNRIFKAACGHKHPEISSLKPLDICRISLLGIYGEIESGKKANSREIIVQTAKKLCDR